MATLTVWKFDRPDDAGAVSGRLEELAKQELLELHDAATVSWPEDASKPKTRQLHELPATGALGGGFWGLLFGLIFLVPLLGAALGAATGAAAGQLTDVGIDDDFIARVRETIVPGTSALFVLSSHAVWDRIREEFPTEDATLVQTNLSAEQEDALRRVFSE